MQSRWRVVAVVGAGALVAVALFLVLSGGEDSDSVATPTTTTEPRAQETTPKEKPSPGPGATTIAFEDGAPVGGVQDVEVSSGDEVRLRVTSDAPADVHIHGYELEGEAAPGEAATFDFRATAEGEFEVEAHRITGGHEEEGVQIASLTVTP